MIGSLKSAADAVLQKTVTESPSVPGVVAIATYRIGTTSMKAPPGSAFSARMPP